jgi:hypothetical protein
MRFTSPFRCSSCGIALCVAPSYKNRRNVLSIVATGLLAYVLGARGFALFAAVVLGYVPMTVIFVFTMRRIMPPRVILSMVEPPPSGGGDDRQTQGDA